MAQRQQDRPSDPQLVGERGPEASDQTPRRRSLPPLDGVADPPGVHDPLPPRLFVHEPGWRVALKMGSDRAFCYAIWPGQSTYHRISSGELYVHRGDEKLCLHCAGRRGILTRRPRALGTSIHAGDRPADTPTEYDLDEVS